MNNLIKSTLLNPIINYIGAKKARNKFTKAPVIVGGCGRSGTTLLLSILSAHPSIFALPYETKIFSDWKPATNGEENSAVRRLVPERLDRFHRYLLIKPIPSQVTRWCEKSPSNVVHLEKILNYFNNEVCFIHIIRDGRDVMTSKHPERPGEYWVPPSRWVNDVRAGLAFKDHPSVLTVHYEDIVHHHRETLEKICSFIDEPYDNRFEEWFQNASVRRNKAWFTPLQNLHGNSVEKWKKPEYANRLKEILAYPGVSQLLRELRYTA